LANRDLLRPAEHPALEFPEWALVHPVATLWAFGDHPLHLGAAFLAFDEKLGVAVLALLEVARIQVTAFRAEQPSFSLH
tara:strand:+ start:191 stop:427 length:237 start_codon:yes stop_codon:yes gene_type:complete